MPFVRDLLRGNRCRHAPDTSDEAELREAHTHLLDRVPERGELGDRREPEEQRRQLELLIELSEAEVARLADLRRGQGEADLLGAWLDQDIAQAEQRRSWYRARLAAIS